MTAVLHAPVLVSSIDQLSEVVRYYIESAEHLKNEMVLVREYFKSCFHVDAGAHWQVSTSKNQLCFLPLREAQSSS